MMFFFFFLQAVYTVQSNNELAFIAKKLVALNLEEFSTSPNSQNPLVNLLGAGYDAGTSNPSFLIFSSILISHLRTVSLRRIPPSCHSVQLR